MQFQYRMPDKAYSNECSWYGMALLAYTVSPFALFALSIHRQRERLIFHFERTPCNLHKQTLGNLHPEGCVCFGLIWVWAVCSHSTMSVLHVKPFSVLVACATRLSCCMLKTAWSDDLVDDSRDQLSSDCLCRVCQLCQVNLLLCCRQLRKEKQLPHLMHSMLLTPQTQ